MYVRLIVGSRKQEESHGILSIMLACVHHRVVVISSLCRSYKICHISNPTVSSIDFLTLLFAATDCHLTQSFGPSDYVS